MSADQATTAEVSEATAAAGGTPEVTANRFGVLQARRLLAGRQVLANAFILLGVPARKAGIQHDETSDVNAEMLTNASSVVITPGYGMAVAQAQYRSLNWFINCGNAE